MPSARDLLQQADTLMRSNRNVGASDSDEAIPLLTDIAVPGNSVVSHQQQRDEIPVLTNVVTTIPEPASTGPPPVSAEAAPSAAEIAETVYYQVLQNLDLYTERALQEHLTMHLSPILERASSELLATLHANLGGLIRQYVAEAIEKQLGVRPESSK
jgi:hypothetical protein